MNIIRSLSCRLIFSLILISGNLHLYGQAPYKVIFFLLEDCKICISYTQEIKTIQALFSRDSFQFEAVFPHPASTQEGIDLFLNEYELNIQNRLDQDQKIATNFNIHMVPEVLVLDNKTQRAIYQGRIDNSFVALGRKRPKPTQRDLYTCLMRLSEGQTLPYKRTKGFGCFLEMKND